MVLTSTPKVVKYLLVRHTSSCRPLFDPEIMAESSAKSWPAKVVSELSFQPCSEVSSRRSKPFIQALKRRHEKESPWRQPRPTGAGLLKPCGVLHRISAPLSISVIRVITDSGRPIARKEIFRARKSMLSYARLMSRYAMCTSAEPPFVSGFRRRSFEIS